MVPYTMLCQFNLYPDVDVVHRIVVGQDAPESYNLQDADPPENLPWRIERRDLQITA